MHQSLVKIEDERFLSSILFGLWFQICNTSRITMWMHMSFGASILSLLFIAVNDVGRLIQIESFFVAVPLRLLGCAESVILACFLWFPANRPILKLRLWSAWFQGILQRCVVAEINETHGLLRSISDQSLQGNLLLQLRAPILAVTCSVEKNLLISSRRIDIIQEHLSCRFVLYFLPLDYRFLRLSESHTDIYISYIHHF